MDVKSVRSDEQETQAGLHTSGTAPAVLEPPQLSRLGRVVTVIAVVQACGMAAIFLFFLLGCKMSAFEAWTHLALVSQTLLGYGVLLLAMLAWHSRFGSKLKAPTAMAFVLANGLAAAVLAAIFLFFLLGCQMSAFEAWKHLGMVGPIMFGYAALAGATFAARTWYGHAA